MGTDKFVLVETRAPHVGFKTPGTPSQRPRQSAQMRSCALKLKQRDWLGHWIWRGYLVPEEFDDRIWFLVWTHGLVVTYESTFAWLQELNISYLPLRLKLPVEARLSFNFHPLPPCQDHVRRCQKYSEIAPQIHQGIKAAQVALFFDRSAGRSCWSIGVTCWAFIQLYIYI